MDWYKHYIGDYQRDTMRLSMVEDSAYRRLMDEYYATEKPLPLDHTECYLAARCTSKSEKAAVDKILDRYFTKQSDGYHHSRIDREIEKANEIAEINKRNGNRGGRPRKTEPETKQKPDGFYTETQNKSEKKGTTRHQTTRLNTTASGRGQYPDPFEQTWAVYPKRDGANPKGRAYKAWNARVSEGVTTEEIHAGVVAYGEWCRQKGKEGTELVMQAATFFGPDHHYREQWQTPKKERGVAL